MALTDGNSNLVMPVSPMYGGGGYGGGFGFGGDSWGWVILLLLCANGGWGGFGGFGGGYGNMMLGYDFPWLLNGQQGINSNTNEGFQNAFLNDNITSVRDGISSLATQLCNCCSDMQQTVSTGFANAETAANARQIANMQNIFGLQTAMCQGFNGTQAQLAQASSDNRLASADLKYTIATENCADRAALSDGIRDVIANQTAGVQRILDKMCEQELYAERRENDNLRTQLNMATLNASQTRQTADIQNSIISELRSCPIPSQPVYGNQPIFTCPNNNSGCGCNGNFYN